MLEQAVEEFKQLSAKSTFSHHDHEDGSSSTGKALSVSNLQDSGMEFDHSMVHVEVIDESIEDIPECYSQILKLRPHHSMIECSDLSK